MSTLISPKKFSACIAVAVLMSLLAILQLRSPTSHSIKIPYSTNSKSQILNISDVHPPGVVIINDGDVGLGNQLFVYACSYALSRKFDIPLYVSNNLGSKFRPFVLNKFSIPINQSIDFRRPFRSTQMAGINDEDIIFNNITPEMISTKFIYNVENCISEIFFREYKDELKKMFVLKVDPAEGSPLVRQWLNQITNFNQVNSSNEYESVAVHIRRGDYRKDWITPMRFFRLAMMKMLEELGFNKTSDGGKGVKFFVFSDSIDQVKEALFNNTTIYMNELGTTLLQSQQRQEEEELETLLKMLDIADVHYVSKKSSDLLDEEEFYLMTKCRHMIISCSTFSWWAAYLIANENKIIIRPEMHPGFVQRYLNNHVQLTVLFRKIMIEKYWYPSKWIKIDPFFK